MSKIIHRLIFLIFIFSSKLSAQSNEVISKSFDLFQNYPNPFNDSPVIGFTVRKPVPMNISLEIYNIRGEKVADC